ncbi:MAG: hypothetical protein C4523_12730 [Myxococcales bacterium]|nr:MAG: hypothetical protein C4523_12730 [Myxococcales bacterium]
MLLFIMIVEYFISASVYHFTRCRYFLWLLKHKFKIPVYVCPVIRTTNPHSKKLFGRMLWIK